MEEARIQMENLKQKKKQINSKEEKKEVEKKIKKEGQRLKRLEKEEKEEKKKMEKEKKMQQKTDKQKQHRDAIIRKTRSTTLPSTFDASSSEPTFNTLGSEQKEEEHAEKKENSHKKSGVRRSISFLKLRIRTD